MQRKLNFIKVGSFESQLIIIFFYRPMDLSTIKKNIETGVCAFVI